MRAKLAIISFFLASCGGGGGGGSSATPVAPTTLIQSVSIEQSIAPHIENLAVADINGDGLDDIVMGGWMGNGQSASIHIFIQNADGTMTEKTSTWLANNVYGGSNRVLIADFNHDGRPDVILPGYNENNGQIPTRGVVLINNGTSFTRTDLPDYTIAHGACLGDVNNDGYVDVLVAGGTQGSVGGVYINNHDGTFTLNQNLINTVTSSNFFSACAVIKETNGNTEIMFGNTSNVTGYRNNIVVFDSNFHVLSNTGINALDANGHPTQGSDLINIGTIDANGDGYQDFIGIYNLVGANATPAYPGDTAATQLFTNNKNSTFSLSQTLDSAVDNLYYVENITVGGNPALFIPAANDSQRLYERQNNSLVSVDHTAFYNMALAVGITSPDARNFAETTPVVYQNSTTGKYYIFESINGNWYTYPLQ